MIVSFSSKLGQKLVMIGEGQLGCVLDHPGPPWSASLASSSSRMRWPKRCSCGSRCGLVLDYRAQHDNHGRLGFLKPLVIICLRWSLARRRRKDVSMSKGECNPAINTKINGSILYCSSYCNSNGKVAEVHWVVLASKE